MRDKEGGNVLASGGFGCVFSPALKCNDKTNENTQPQSKKKHISKLMLKKYAIQEYDEIKNIKEKLKYIHNYEDYFLIENFST